MTWVVHTATITTGFEQDLFDAMEILRMDEENFKTKGVHRLASTEKHTMPCPSV